MKCFVKKLVAVLLCVVLSISFCSCDSISDTINTISSLISPRGIVEDTSLGYTEIDRTPFVYSQYYTPLDCKESYELLENDKMRELYTMLYENCYFVYPKSFSDGEYKCRQAVLEESQLSEAQVRLTIKALTDDNPQIFWLTTTFGYLMDENKDYTAVQLYSRESPDKLLESVEKLKTEANSFYATLEKGLSEYEREKLIHDFVLSACEYDESLTDVENVPLSKDSAFDPYGVLVENIAVCEGYARTFQMLCNGVGIRCVNIIGESEEQLHMWNAVELDGDWYYVDTTWDDSDDEALQYDYFNISEKQLTTDHTFSPIYTQMTDEEICGDGEINALTSNFFIPTCNSTAYNYYVRECAHLTSYDSSEITDSLLVAAEEKQPYFHFYIDPREFTYEYAVDQLFYSYPQYFFDYIDDVNSTLSDYSIDYNNLSLYEKETLSVVSVILKYV